MAMAKDEDKDAEEKEEKEEGDAKEKGDAKEGEEDEGAEGESEAPKKTPKKKIVIMGVLALLLLIGGGSGAYFTGLFGKHEEKAAETVAGGKSIAAPVYYTMPELLVNLNSGTRQTSFLKATVVLELADAQDVPLIQANLPRLRDAINTYLHELRASDLSGSAGIERLREELLLRANRILAPVRIKDVLFSEIIVQ